jgi:farnesyl diphosphate synthase
VSVLSLDAAKARLAALEQEAIAALDVFGPAADVLRAAASFAAKRGR